MSGLPAWAARLSKKRQRELLERLTAANRKAGAALHALSERVEREIREAQPTGAFVEEYNRGYQQALADAFAAGFPGLDLGSVGGFRSYGVGGATTRVQADGRLRLTQ